MLTAYRKLSLEAGTTEKATRHINGLSIFCNSMDIFLSWSGKKSKALAEALAKWLPLCVQSVRPWISSHDIEKGHRWGLMLAERLETTSFGIICLTPGNLASPWILFEAGALSKSLSAKTCTLLVDLTPANVDFPLGQFQHTLATKDDFYKLVSGINKACGEQALEKERLDLTFDSWWPDLEKQILELPSEGEHLTSSKTDRDILEEILDAVKPLPPGASNNSGPDPTAPAPTSGKKPAVSKPPGESKSEPLRENSPTIAIPLTPELRDAYQRLYDANENLLESTGDPRLLEPLNDIRTNVGNILTKDNLYRLEANTVLFRALSTQIATTNFDLTKLRGQIQSLASKVKQSGEVATAIDRVLRVATS